MGISNIEKNSIEKFAGMFDDSVQESKMVVQTGLAAIGC